MDAAADAEVGSGTCQYREAVKAALQSGMDIAELKRLIDGRLAFNERCS